MTDPELIDAAYTHWLDIGNIDADDQVVRDRIRLHGDQVCRRFWAAYPWPFKQGFDMATADVADGGFVDLPTDFQTFGSQGIVALTGQRFQLRYLNPVRLLRLAEIESGQRSSRPAYYAQVGSRLRIHMPPNATMDLDLYYDRKFPALSETTPTPPDPWPLQSIPDQWHEPVILEGVIARLMEDEGDSRAPAFEGRYRQGVALAWNEERQGRNEAKRGPRYGRGRRGAWL